MTNLVNDTVIFSTVVLATVLSITVQYITVRNFRRLGKERKKGCSVLMLY